MVGTTKGTHLTYSRIKPTTPISINTTVTSTSTTSATNTSTTTSPQQQKQPNKSILAELSHEAEGALDKLLIKDIGTRDEVFRLIDAVLNDESFKKNTSQKSTIAACCIYLIAKKKAYSVSIRELCGILGLNIRGFSEYLIRIKSRHHSMVHHGASVWKNLPKIIRRMNFSSGQETSYIIETIKSLIRICRFRDNRFEYEAAHVTYVLAFFAWQSFDPYGIVHLERKRFKPRQFVTLDEFFDLCRIARSSLVTKLMLKVNELLFKLAEEFRPCLITNEVVVLEMRPLLEFGLKKIPANSEHDIKDMDTNYSDQPDEDESLFLADSCKDNATSNQSGYGVAMSNIQASINKLNNIIPNVGMNNNILQQATTSNADQLISNNNNNNNNCQLGRKRGKQLFNTHPNAIANKLHNCQILSEGVYEPWTAEEIFANIPIYQRDCDINQNDQDLNLHLLTEGFDFTESLDAQIHRENSNKKRLLANYKISIAPENGSKESIENFCITLRKTITVVEFEGNENNSDEIHLDSDIPSPLIHPDEIAGEPEVLELDCD